MIKTRHNAIKMNEYKNGYFKGLNLENFELILRLDLWANCLCFRALYGIVPMLLACRTAKQ